MYMVIQVARKDNAKAWGVLARHSIFSAFRDRTFVISKSAAGALRKAGVKFKEDLKSYLRQKEILIVEKEVKLL